MHASAAGHPHTAELLLHYGHHLDHTNAEGKTALEIVQAQMERAAEGEGHSEIDVTAAEAMQQPRQDGLATVLELLLERHTLDHAADARDL